MWSKHPSPMSLCRLSGQFLMRLCRRSYNNLKPIMMGSQPLCCRPLSKQVKRCVLQIRGSCFNWWKPKSETSINHFSILFFPHNFDLLCYEHTLSFFFTVITLESFVSIRRPYPHSTIHRIIFSLWPSSVFVFNRPFYWMLKKKTLIFLVAIIFSSVYFSEKKYYYVHGPLNG